MKKDKIKILEYIYELVEQIETEDRDVEDVLDSIVKMINKEKEARTNMKKSQRKGVN